MVTRRSFIKKSIAGGAYLVFTVPVIGKKNDDDELWFVHLTDTHIGENEVTRENLRYVLQDITAEFPQAKFLAVTGDITEHGWEEELMLNYNVMEEGELRYYNVMGNHDSRWSRSGRRAFVEQFGDTRWAIEHPRVNVYLIDSSVLLQQYGYIDPSELQWLEEQLSNTGDHPAMIGFHHPPGTDRNFIGSEKDLFKLVSAFNIPVIMAGHVHTPTQRKVNGTWIITSGATHPPERGYNIFRADNDGIHLYTRDPVADVTTYKQKIDYNKKVRNTPSESDGLPAPVKLNSDSIQVQLPSEFYNQKVTTQLSGITIPHTIQNDHININIDHIGRGDYELLLCSPDPTASEQKRTWGTVQINKSNEPIRWKRRLEAGIQCEAAFYENLVIIGCHNGNLYGIDMLTGVTRWKRRTGKYEILSSPRVANDSIFFGTMDEHIHCADALTGELQWRIPVRGSVIATGIIVNDMYVFGTGQGVLYAINTRNGEVLWTFKADNLIKATPAWDGTHFYFGAWDGYFYCVNGKTGTLKWKKYINVPHFAPATSNPKVHNGRVYFVSHDYRTHCLDADSGEVVWQFPAADVEYNYQSSIIERCQPSYSSAVFFMNRVYFCSITGHVVGFNIDTGEIESEYELDAPVFDSFPILVGDCMYFGTIRGTVRGIDLRAGDTILKYSLGYEYIFSPPAERDGSLIIGTLGGALAHFEI